MAAAVAKTLLARAWAAASAFGSMILLAWIAAFARAVFEHGWSGFRTLGGDSLSSASMQAARHEGDLVPVLAVWGALLFFTPSGFTIAFRGAAVAAAALGALIRAAALHHHAGAGRVRPGGRAVQPLLERDLAPRRPSWWSSPICCCTVR